MGCPSNTGIDVGFGDCDQNKLETMMSGKTKMKMCKKLLITSIVMITVSLTISITYYIMK